jgi:hypothetical protein
MENLILPEIYSAIKVIDEEGPKIRSFISLLESNFTIVFAPDYSEINNYIAPFRDIRPKTFEYDLRRWLTIKAFFENSDYEKALIPPYFAELVNISKMIKRKVTDLQEVYTTYANVLDQLSENFEQILAASQSENYDLNDSISKYGKEIGFLLELRSKTSEIERLNDLWESSLKQARERINLEDDSIFGRSLVWQKRIFETRKKAILEARNKRPVDKKISEEDIPKSDIDSINRKSHFDGLAVEFLKTANERAIANPAGNPFIIFLTSSSDLINKAIEGKLEFTIPGNGRFKVQSIWSPNTLFAYHVLKSYKRSGEEKLSETLDKAYILAKKISQQQTGKPTRDEVAELFDIEAIENFLLYSEKADDDNIYNFMSLKKFQSLFPAQSNKHIENIYTYLKTIDVKQTLEHITSRVNWLWKNITDQPTWNTDGVNFISLRSHNHHVWIRFDQDTIPHELEANKDIFSLDELKLRDYFQGKVSELEVKLLVAFQFIYYKEFNQLDILLKTLRAGDYEENIELLLLDFASRYIQEKKITDEFKKELIKYATCEDARLYRALSLIEWKRKNINEALKYSELALDCVPQREKLSLECYNNYVYFLAQVFEEKPGEISRTKLESEYQKLLAKFKELQDKYPEEPDIYHTFGKTAFVLGKDPSLSIESRINLLEEAKKNLHKAAGFASGEDIYLDDLFELNRYIEINNIPV